MCTVHMSRLDWICHILLGCRLIKICRSQKHEGFCDTDQHLLPALPSARATELLDERLSWQVSL